MSIICYDSEQNLLERLYQWDVNQTISVTGISTSQAPAFHFCNQRSEVALVVAPTMVNGMLTAEIPNILLREPETLFVYIYYNTGADGYRTFYRIRIPVVPRQRPQNYDDSDNVNFVSAEVLDAQLVDLIADMAESASANLLSEVYDIRNGYDGTVYSSAGDAVRAIGETLSSIDRTPNIFYFDTEAEWNTYYSNNSGMVRPGDFIVINNETLRMKTQNSVELLISKGDLYKKPSDGIPMSDLSTEVQLAIASGSGSGETIYIEGNSIKIFGFNSESAYNEYKTLNPDAIHNGDYVWIKNITPFSKAYNLFVVDSQATGGKTLIFTVDDTFLITVSKSGNTYTADHTFTEAVQAYYDGKTPTLLTDYGTLLQVSRYGIDTYGNPTHIEFSGVLYGDNGVFYSTTYILSMNGIGAETQAVGPVIIDVSSTGAEGVVEISAVNGMPFSGGISFNGAMYVYDLINNGHAFVVLHFNNGYYPYANGNQQSLYFGAIDPFDQSYVLFSWTQRASFVVNSIPISGGSSGGGGADITDGSILKRYLAADVQTSLAKADTAVQKAADIGVGRANSTVSSTTTKTATITGFKLVDGANVSITFSYAVGAGATLNISNGSSNTGAKRIWYRGARITANVIDAGNTALFVYNPNLEDGSGAYDLIGLDTLKPSGGWAKTDLASAVQTLIDGAVQNNFGSANNGKPIVVNSDGNAVVGSWPSSDGSGGTVTWQDILPNGGIPGTDLSTDVQNAILANKYFIAFNSADGITGTLANVTSIDDLYNLWYGNKYYVALDYTEYGDYEFPLVFIDSSKAHAVFAGVFRDTSTGVAKIATFYASESNNTVTAVKSVTTPGSGSGVPSGGWTESDLSSSVLNNLYMAGGMVSNSETYATTTRSINIAGYRLVTGAMFTVKFTYKLKASSKLQVSADGGTTYTADKFIYFGSSQLAENQIKAGDTITFRYDGNYYQVIARIPATPESGGTGATVPTPASGTTQNPSADEGKILTVDSTGSYILTTVSSWATGGSY